MTTELCPLKVRWSIPKNMKQTKVNIHIFFMTLNKLNQIEVKTYSGSFP